MNKRAQETMGIILTVFIGVLVAVVLFQAAAQQVGETAIKRTLSQGQYTAPAAGAVLDLIGAELLTDTTVTVTNKSNGINFGVNDGANYSIYEGVSSSTGVKIIQLKPKAGSLMASQNINVSYTYGADGYVTDTGAVAVIGLIVIFAALAVAVIALVPTLRSGILNIAGL